MRVVDRDGEPVRGLTAANFTVHDDGRPQAIVGFDAIDLAEKSAVPGLPVHPAARRRFLILFDFSFSRPKSILVARKAARDFVLSGMSSGDLASVATYSVEQGVRLLVTFSSDRAQLAQAIESLGLEARRESLDPLAFAFDAATLAAMAQTRNSRNSVEGLIETLQAYSAVNKARSDEYTRGRVRHLFQAFRELSQSLNAVEGRKDILYLSEGFSGRHLVGGAGERRGAHEPAPRRDLESGRGPPLRQHAAAQRVERGRRVVPPIRLRRARGGHRRHPRRGRLGWR